MKKIQTPDYIQIISRNTQLSKDNFLLTIKCEVPTGNFGDDASAM